MARPTGRYFASVITKIRDAKKKEQIVVDGNFKLQLRQQLMMKISAAVKPPKAHWSERLLPLKSYLAVVPAFALVIVAVVGISRLPIQFNSNVVVPFSAPSQQNGGTILPLAESTSSLLNTQTSGYTGSGLKTFPGRLVLPSSYMQGGQTASTAAPFFQPQSLETNVETPSVNPQAGTSVSSGAQVQAPNNEQTNFQNAPTFSNVTVGQNVPFQNASSGAGQQFPGQQNVAQENLNTFISPPASPDNSAPVLPSVSGSVPSVQNSPDNTGSVSPSSTDSSVSGSMQSVSTDQMNQAPSAVSASEPQIQAGTDTNVPTQENVTTVIDSNVQTPLVTAPVPVVAPETNAAVTAPAVTVTPVPAAVSEPKAKVSVQPSVPKETAIPGLNEIAALPAEHLDMGVYYKGDFSGDEKTILEKNLLPRLVTGKDADYATVSQKDAATTHIELHFHNGAVRFYDYQIDADGALHITRVNQ